jgi:hypothetical protein
MVDAEQNYRKLIVVKGSCSLLKIPCQFRLPAIFFWTKVLPMKTMGEAFFYVRRQVCTSKKLRDNHVCAVRRKFFPSDKSMEM